MSSDNLILDLALRRKLKVCIIKKKSTRCIKFFSLNMFSSFNMQKVLSLFKSLLMPLFTSFTSLCKSLFQPLFISLFLMLAFSLQAEASLRTLIIDGGQVDGLPIAISPFKVENGEKTLGEEMTNVIKKDLQTSGQFKVFPPQNSGVAHSPSKQSEVQYPYWQNIGVEDLVVGYIQKTGSNYTVHFELLDVLGQKGGPLKTPLLSMRFDNVNPQLFRNLAHHISNLIFQKLIGVKGFFESRIAYISVTQGPKGLVRVLEVADYDGVNPKSLVRSDYPLMSPSWSPDGQKIAFVSFEKERSSINVVDVKTGNVQRITQFPGINSAPAWSPDGRKLAMVLSKDGSPKIYTMDLSNKQLSNLTSGTGIDTEPFWSPDGRSIVFTSDRGGKPQIYRVTLGAGKVERLTFAGTYNAKPSLTPDGKNLVTLHRNTEGLFSIAVHNLGNGAVKVLTQTGLNDSPALAPNGMMVMYGAQEEGQGVLGAVTLDGRLKIKLPAREGTVQEPAWSPFNS